MAEDRRDVLAFEESVHPNYKKGFEHGYWLQRGKSKDLDGIIAKTSTWQAKEYSEGLRAGKKEAVREAFRERMAQFDKDRENDKGKDLERD